MRIYLGGPIRGCTDQEAKDWREKMKQALPSVTIYDPMAWDFRGQEQEQSSSIVTLDKHYILRSDLCVFNFWHSSVGTPMELLFSNLHGKITLCIVPDMADVSPWIIEHTDILVNSVDTAIKAVKDYARKRDSLNAKASEVEADCGHPECSACLLREIHRVGWDKAESLCLQEEDADNLRQWQMDRDGCGRR